MEEKKLPFPTDKDAPNAEKRRNPKPLAVVSVQATVLEEPRIKKIGSDELYTTYCAILTNFHPFNTEIFSKNKPELSVGEQIEIELTTTDYKLRFKREK